MVHHLDTAVTGAVGCTAPIAAATLSLDPALDFEMRIASMMIGILVGLASFSKLCYDIWADHNKREK